MMRHTKIASLLMATAVVFGAFGAHSLKVSLSPDRLSSWKTGVLYMIIHTFAVLILSLSSKQMEGENQKVVSLSSNLFFTGILLFSGSIFLLSTQSLTGIHTKWLGPLTPIGGILFILGWINLIRLKQ